MKSQILVVDDEIAVLRALERFLTEKGFEVTLADTFDKAAKVLESGRIDLALIDLKLGDRDGIELVQYLQKVSPQTACMILTGFGSIDTAIQAIKAGAFHYVTKPFQFDDLLNLVQKALEHQRTREENRLLKKQLNLKYGLENIVGVSDGMKSIFELVAKVADTDSTVLLLGESGTGKELVAKAIHYNSRRSQRPLVPVNCAAIPEDLLESELFGHVKGAFTGAVVSRTGRFEMADGGTLFLDEIGDMSPKLQVKLLRVLQERRFEPVGSGRSVEVDVRIIAATNKNLERAVKERTFREDLFYRLNVIPIRIPPLRERKGDIPMLIEHFLQRFAKENGKKAPQVTPECMQMLSNYAWPGNVRELENAIERLVILKPEQVISIKDLPEKFLQGGGKIFTSVNIPDNGISFKNVVNDFENELILRALEKTAWNKNKAATLLKLNRTTLVEKIKRRQLEKVILS
ncbi:sigma-54-dependent Fis family transcriptional regulator [Deltaproteobacteria bacterium PRO3]|nr:sigma-54-dependent Fis family transcriptional regulator [Deltaproteobacteria bacterium PRO3]